MASYSLAKQNYTENDMDLCRAQQFTFQRNRGTLDRVVGILASPLALERIPSILVYSNYIHTVKVTWSNYIRMYST